ncbi:Homeobox-leucine zipper protein HDG11 [Sesbania bispinosa]|nr:Homeobox-leucine zipper protein HDG11 [Sesbania bispinosa]
MNLPIRSGDSSMLSIIPSGFVVSPNSQPKETLGAIISENVDRSRGSLLTVPFQVLASSPDGSKLLNMEFVTTLNALLTSTVKKVKEALNFNSAE